MTTRAGFVALIGEPNAGKSTLLKVMAGLVEADRGARVLGPGTSVGYMEQEPDMAGFATLGAFATSALEPSELYKVERVAEGLKFDPDRPVETASGGERRRAVPSGAFNRPRCGISAASARMRVE